MHSHHGGKTVRAHFDRNDQPILVSAICCCCEDGAGNRMASWSAAKRTGSYDEGSRKPLDSGRCAFCRKKIGKAD